MPSTPTVISRRSNPLFSLILSTTAAIPAPHSWAARLDTAPQTVLTMMLSSQVLLSPSCWRMVRTCSKANLSLWEENTVLQVSLSQATSPTALMVHPPQAAASPDSTSDPGECKFSHPCTLLQGREGVQAATEAPSPALHCLPYSLLNMGHSRKIFLTMTSGFFPP